MPVYEFIADDGKIEEVFLSYSEYDRRVIDGAIQLDDGRIAKMFWGSLAGISTVPANYPMVSEAAGVHPSQIKEHMDHLRKMGCGQVNHTKDGSVIFESKGQRKKVCEALGLYDRNGGYSDPSPKIRTTKCKTFR